MTILKIEIKKEIKEELYYYIRSVMLFGFAIYSFSVKSDFPCDINVALDREFKEQNVTMGFSKNKK